jgi:translocation and assembly module TamA
VRWVLVGLVVVVGCAHAPPSPEAKEVDALTIEGMEKLSQGDLQDKLLTTASSWVPWWVPLLGHTGWFEPSAWQADLRRITRFYEANGYYHARVLTEQVTPTAPGHVALAVTLREGAPSRLSSLKLEGLDALEADHRAVVVAELPLKVPEIFVEATWTRTKTLLGSRLRELGYAAAVVTGEAVVDAEQVEATLTAVPGVRFRIGEVRVATEPGARIPPAYLVNVASTEVKPGDWYSDHALKTAQIRVLQMGVLSGVKVTRGEPDDAAGTVPVDIDVREAPFNSVRFGFGLGGDLIRQEVRVTGEYVNRNLGLAGHFLPEALLDRLTLKAKLGWTFLPTVWDVASGSPSSKTGPTAVLKAQYEVPRLFGIPTLTLQTSLELSRMIDAAFGYTGGEAKGGVVWRPRTDLSIFPSLNFDAYVLDAQVSVQDNVPVAALGCPLGAPCLIAFLDVTTEYDRRDSRLEPKEGLFLGLGAQAGLAQTTQVKPYLRFVPEARAYVSFGQEKRVTLAGRLRAGTLISADEDTPILARFFSGGSGMRGFNARRLSPLVAVPRTVYVNGVKGYDPLDGETLPIGGNGLLEASLELRWAAWADLVLAVFTDWGLVSSAPLGPKVNFARQLYAAVGIGARYLTPVGPIRIDLGVRLPFIGQPLELQPGVVQAFKSSPGCFFGSFAAPPTAQATALPYAGSPDSLCSFHLSIGEAF